MSVVHASHGGLTPASQAPAERAGDRRRHGPRGAGRANRRSTGRPWSPTTTASATGSPRWSPASTTSTPGSGVPAASRCPTPPRERRFRTATGKAKFTVDPIPYPDRARRAGCCCMTIRSHDQYNTTIYGLDDRYRGINGERRVVFVNPATSPRSAWSTARSSTSSASSGARPGSPPGSSSSPTTSPPAAPPRTTPKPTSSSPSTTSPTAAAPRPPNPSSSAWWRRGAERRKRPQSEDC